MYIFFLVSLSHASLIFQTQPGALKKVKDNFAP